MLSFTSLLESNNCLQGLLYFKVQNASVCLRVVFVWVKGQGLKQLAPGVEPRLSSKVSRESRSRRVKMTDACDVWKSSAAMSFHVLRLITRAEQNLPN